MFVKITKFSVMLFGRVLGVFTHLCVHNSLHQKAQKAMPTLFYPIFVPIINTVVDIVDGLNSGVEYSTPMLFFVQKTHIRNQFHSLAQFESKKNYEKIYT